MDDQASQFRRLTRQSFDRSELIFAACTIGLAVVVGMVSPPEVLKWQILIVLWSALVGMMIPRIVEVRRAASAPPPVAAVNPDTVDLPTMRHDMASALMTIEGGVTALRCLQRDQQEPDRAESIVHAIETEIRRIRRLSMQARSSTAGCMVVETIRPLVALHRANGMTIECDFAADVSVAIASDDLARVMANLLENCALHAPNAAVRVSGYSIADLYELVVHDNGPGITSDLVGDACLRGISSRPGGGLGLYSVRAIVESSGGTVSIDLSRGGTAMRLGLPMAASPMAGTEQPGGLTAATPQAG